MLSLVIDLTRLLIAFRASVAGPAGIRERLFQCLFKAAEWDGTWSLPLSKTKQTNILLLLRTISNAFQDGSPIAEGGWVNQVWSHLYLTKSVLANAFVDRYLKLWGMGRMKLSISRSVSRLRPFSSSQ